MMLEALPLIATPTIIVAMLSPEVREPTRKLSQETALSLNPNHS